MPTHYAENPERPSNLATVCYFIAAICEDILGRKNAAQLTHADYISLRIVRLLVLSIVFIAINSILAVPITIAVLYSFMSEGLLKNIFLVAADVALIGGVCYAYYPLVSIVDAMSKKYNNFWESSSSTSNFLRKQFTQYVAKFVNVITPVLVLHIVTSCVTFISQISHLSVSTFIKDSFCGWLDLGIFIIVVVVCVWVCYLLFKVFWCLFYLKKKIQRLYLIRFSIY